MSLQHEILPEEDETELQEPVTTTQPQFKLTEEEDDDNISLQGENELPSRPVQTVLGPTAPHEEQRKNLLQGALREAARNAMVDSRRSVINLPDEDKRSVNLMQFVFLAIAFITLVLVVVFSVEYDLQSVPYEVTLTQADGLLRFSFNIVGLIYIVIIICLVFRLTILTYLQAYYSELDFGRNKFRWMEMAISGGLQKMIIFELLHLNNLALIIMTAFFNVFCCYLAHKAECTRVITPTRRPWGDVFIVFGGLVVIFLDSIFGIIYFDPSLKKDSQIAATILSIFFLSIYFAYFFMHFYNVLRRPREIINVDLTSVVLQMLMFTCATAGVFFFLVVLGGKK